MCIMGPSAMGIVVPWAKDVAGPLAMCIVGSWAKVIVGPWVSFLNVG